MAVAPLDGDGDGDRDLVALDPFDNLVTFEAVDALAYEKHELDLSLATGPLAAGDLDGDGDPDLAAPNGPAVWIENTGGWALGPAREVSLATTSRSSVGLADLDGDGDLDLWSRSDYHNTLGWYPNLGAATFGAEIVLRYRVQVEAVAPADADRDGDLDLLVATLGEGVTWMENLGGGAFGGPVPIGSGLDAPVALAAADLDGDADPDVVVAHAGLAYLDADPYPDVVGAHAGLSWIENTGGAFGAIHEIAATLGDLGTYPPFDSLEAADLDGDGDLDLATATLDAVSWWENTGYPDADADGLADGSEPSLGADPSVADTDGGGVPDGVEARAGLDPADPADDFARDRDGDRAPDGEELAEGTDPDRWDSDGDGIPDGGAQADHASDADGDALSDLAEAAMGTDPAEPDTDGGGRLDGDERLLERDPLDASDDWPLHEVGDLPASHVAIAADLDGDGFVDLVGGESDEAPWVRYGAAGPTWGEPVVLPGDYNYELSPSIATDLDGDGDLDLLLPPGATPWLEQVDRDWVERSLPGDTPSVGDECWCVGDLDGDGAPDVVAGGEDGGWWWGNLGGGSFAPGVTVTDAEMEACVLADLDGDGLVDLAATFVSIGAVLWRQGLGGGALGDWRIIDADGEFYELLAWDPDLDGDLDLVTANFPATTADLVTWRNDAGAWHRDSFSVAGNTWYAGPLAAADLDRDGDDDLLAVLEDVVWIENDGGALGVTRSIGVWPFEDHWSFAVARIDDDDDPDVFTNGGTGAVWYEHAGASDAGPSDGGADRDGDGLDAEGEASQGTDVLAWDSDADGLSDGAEVARGTDPVDADTDADGSSDGEEVRCESDPLDVAVFDLDCDHLADASEPRWRTDPADPDTDDDGLLDGDEVRAGTLPLVAHTDGGATADGVEVELGTDPLDPGDDWDVRPFHPSSGRLAVADVDLDGEPDLVTHGAAVVALVDVDGDGWPDLLAGAADGVTWVRNVGGDLRGEPAVVDLATDCGSGIAAIDLDADGDPEVVCAPSGEGTGSLRWFENLGGGVFGAAGDVRSERTTGLAPADVDRDGDLDLLAASLQPGAVVGFGDGPCEPDAPCDVVWFENLGTGSLASAVTLVQGSFLVRPMEVAGADLDGDEATDLAVLAANIEAAATLLVDDAVVARIPGRPVSLVAADLDGDGDIDLGWATTARFGWAEQTGDGLQVRGIAPIGVDDLVAVLGGHDGPALATSAGGELSTWTHPTSRRPTGPAQHRRCGCASAPGDLRGCVMILALIRFSRGRGRLPARVFHTRHHASCSSDGMSRTSGPAPTGSV